MLTFFLYILVAFSFLSEKDEATMLKEKLQNQASCWNNGDIDCFMEDYWHDDKLMYIGKSGVTYGWKNTLENYKKRYPTKKEMGHLTFDIISLDPLGDQHYHMVGKWHLDREIGNIEGHFSLIWKKIDGNWVIVADHSS